jgi:outer membrane protein assembly factor BamB
MRSAAVNGIRGGRLLVVCGVLVLCASPLLAGDWPQILGPQRSGIAEGEQLADSWPESGPPIVWKQPVGQGSAGVAVVDGTLVLFHRLEDREVVAALDAATGEAKWTKSYPTTFVSQVGSDDGPLCVPTIVGGRVVTFGPQGVLSLWSLADGTLHWQRKTHEDFDALEGYFGAGSTPLVEVGRIIVNVGGAKAGAGIVAFDLNNGRDLWKATQERANYSAPTAATLGGRQVVLCITRMKCVGLAPQTGEVLFEIPFGRGGPTVNAATPVVMGDEFFLTASYGVGAVLARVTRSGAEEVWRKSDVMSSQYTTPVAHDGVLYGIDGRDDIPPAHLRCIDPKTGRVLWSEDNFGYATLVRAGDKLIVVTTGGELVLARANPKAYEELGRHRLTSDTLRALPALAGGRLYVRDGSTLYCVNVGRP